MHHYNTILSQMLKMFSRYEFQKAVFETKAEYHTRGFSSWNHFVAMLFGQLSGQDSLRGIEAGLATQGANLYLPASNQFTAQRLPMPTNTAPMSSLKKLSSGCCPNVKQ